MKDEQTRLAIEALKGAGCGVLAIHVESRIAHLEKTKESLCKALDSSGDSLIEAGERITVLEQDNQEQCRLNAMGAEREARLMARVKELEKDAARLEFLQTSNLDGEGLRYEVNCFVVDGQNQFTIYDEVKEGFVSGEWSSDFRAAIDTAMQKD